MLMARRTYTLGWNHHHNHNHRHHHDHHHPLFIIIITTCLQTSRGSSVWSNCSRVQEAHESLAKAEEDGLRLPGHGCHDDDQIDGGDEDDDDDNADDGYPSIRSCQLTLERPPQK